MNDVREWHPDMKNKWTHVLSDGVVQELVASQVTLQPSDVEAVRVAQAFQPRKLDRHPDFITWVFGLRAVHAFIRAALGVLEIRKR
jgi:hypothetical protein